MTIHIHPSCASDVRKIAKTEARTGLVAKADGTMEPPKTLNAFDVVLDETFDDLSSIMGKAAELSEMIEAQSEETRKPLKETLFEIMRPLK